MEELELEEVFVVEELEERTIGMEGGGGGVDGLSSRKTEEELDEVEEEEDAGELEKLEVEEAFAEVEELGEIAEAVVEGEGGGGVEEHGSSSVCTAAWATSCDCHIKLISHCPHLNWKPACTMHWCVLRCDSVVKSRPHCLQSKPWLSLTCVVKLKLFSKLSLHCEHG